MKIFVLVFMIALSFAVYSSDHAQQAKASNSGEQEIKEYEATGDEATISGTVFFEGEVTEPKVIDTSDDPYCHSVDSNIVGDGFAVSGGHLANVMVYVKSESPAIADLHFSVPETEVRVTYLGCKVAPHVVGIQTKQPVVMLNSDQTNHNPNVLTERNEPFNVSMGPGASPLRKNFPREEIVITIKCNLHSWEKFYLGVFKHPFFSVTGEDGTFQITGLPPGAYQVGTWHEKLGQKTQKITVSPRESKNLDFTYK